MHRCYELAYASLLEPRRLKRAVRCCNAGPSARAHRRVGGGITPEDVVCLAQLLKVSGGETLVQSGRFLTSETSIFDIGIF